MRLLWESFYVRHVVEMLPETTAHRREWLIQNAKLSRLIGKPPGGRLRGPLHMLSGGSLKKLNKEKAKRNVLIGQQAMKLRSLTDKLFKEFLRSGPNPAQKTNAEYRKWKAQFDSAINDRIVDSHKQVTERLVRRFLGPSS
jgi:hypothetical protein